MTKSLVVMVGERVRPQRIAQVSFQVRIDPSSESTTAKRESREIQNTKIDAS